MATLVVGYVRREEVLHDTARDGTRAGAHGDRG